MYKDKAELERDIENRIRVMNDDTLLDEFERVSRTEWYNRTAQEDLAYDMIRALLLSRMAKPVAG